MIPISRPLPSTIGTPEIRNRFISAGGFAERAVGTERDRVQDHPALAPLDPVDFGGLPVDRHVLVDHADAAGPRHGDGHFRLGHGVHRGGDQRDVELDAPGEPAAHIHILRMDRRVPRNQQHIVESQGVAGAKLGSLADRRTGGLAVCNYHKRPLKTHQPAACATRGGLSPAKS